MCGISGLISFSQLGNGNDIVHRMNERIIHRGPDAEGLYEYKNVFLGHRRLSIIDLSDAANQPMHKHDYTLVFNGEIYNYIELKAELESVGYLFETNSDSEVILSAYHYFGDDCVRKFNGMWAFLLLDKTQNTVLVSRDQFGIKPLYYHVNDSLMAFASEIKQFLELPQFKPSLNTKVAAAFLINGSLNQQQETFFDSILELKPGQNLVIDLNTNKFEFRHWYSFKSFLKSDASMSYSDAVSQFSSIFEDAVKIRMRSDVNVGSCLSGGIDSSAIVCQVKDLGEQLETVTSCYTDRKFDEQQFSDVVSAATSFKSNKIYGDSLEIDKIAIHKKMVYHQDQPIATGSHFSEYNVFSESRKIGFIVMLDGQGSDEYLGGYPEFKTIAFKFLLKNLKLKALWKFITDESQLMAVSPLSIIKREFKSLFYYPSIQKLKSILGKENSEFAAELKNQFKQKKSNTRNFQELSVLELEQTSIPYQLHSEDRNSMLFSIESRLPFLDHRLVEFCLSLPQEYKLREGYSKKILRDAVTSLPKEIKERKDKMGFVSPDEAWVRENAEFMLEKFKLALSKYQFITITFIEQFNQFLMGKRAYESKYFRAMSLVVFCEEFDLK